MKLIFILQIHSSFLISKCIFITEWISTSMISWVVSHNSHGPGRVPILIHTAKKQVMSHGLWFFQTEFKFFWVTRTKSESENINTKKKNLNPKRLNKSWTKWLWQTTLSLSAGSWPLTICPHQGDPSLHSPWLETLKPTHVSVVHCQQAICSIKGGPSACTLVPTAEKSPGSTNTTLVQN